MASFSALNSIVFCQISDQHGVTLTTPPVGDHFAEFHGRPKPSIAKPAPTWEQPQYSDHSSHPPYHQQFPSPYYGHQYPGSAQYYPYPPPFQQPPSVPSTSETPNPAQPPSSPTKTDYDVLYPSIRWFLEDLQLKDPRRHYEQHCDDFDALNYYNIDEVITLGKSGLTDTIKMTPGNADYLLKAVRVEIKKAEQDARNRHNM